MDLITQLVYDSVNGNTTVGELSEVCGIDLELTRRIIGKLADQGLVRVPTGLSMPPEQNGTGVGTGKADSDPMGAGAAEQGQQLAEIDELFRTLDDRNYYDLLNVEPDADRKAIRSRYFELSKRYHPDKTLVKNSKEGRDKAAVIFRTMTKAYDTLSNPKLRKQYNASLGDEFEIRLMERKLTAAIEEKRRSQSAPPPPKSETPLTRSQPAVSSAAPVSTPPMSKPPGSRKTPRGASPRPSGNQLPRAPRVSNPAAERVSRRPSQNPKHEQKRKQWQRERAQRAMARMLNKLSSNPPESTSNGGSRLQEARLAVNEGHYSTAVKLLNEILATDPNNRHAKELLVKANAANQAHVAKGHLRQGRFEKLNGQQEKARTHFLKALEVDSGNVEARHLLAELLLEMRQDLTSALKLAKEAVAMEGQRARYYATLGDIYYVGKDHLKAKQAYESALVLEPDNKLYKKRLKSCKS